jgi:hypothetical protein
VVRSITVKIKGDESSLVRAYDKSAAKSVEFGSKVEASSRSADQSLKTLVVRIGDLDKASSRMGDRLSGDLDKVSRSAHGTSSSLRGFHAVVGALSGVAGPATGALLGIPAAITAGAIAAAAVAPAFAGMGTALEAAAEDGREFGAAMRDLSPSARAMVGELLGVRAQLSGLRVTMQEQFWSRLAGDFEDLAGSTLPTLDRRLGAISGTLGEVTSSTLEYLSEAEQVDQIDRILARTNSTLERLNTLTQNGVGFWLDLSEAGSGFVEELVGDLSRLVVDWRATIGQMQASGDLERLFSGAGDAVGGLLDALSTLSGALLTVLASPGSQAAVMVLVSSIQGLASAVGVVADVFAVLPAPVQAVVATVVLLAAVAGPATTAVVRLGVATQATLTRVSQLGPAGAGAASGLGRLAAILAGLQIASAAFGDSTTLSSDRLRLLTADLARYGDTGRIAGETTRALGADMSAFKDDILVFADDGWSRFGTGLAETIEGLTGLGSVVDDSVLHARENISNLDGALAELVQGGHADQAEAAFERLRAAAAKQGISLRELQVAFPEYFAALNGSKTASVEAASGAELLAVGLEAAAAAGRSLISVFDELNGGAIDYARAEIAALESADALTESLRANGRTMDANTEKGRANKQALLDAVEAAAAAAEAKYQETGSVEAASAEYQRHISALRATLRAAGLTEAQVDSLIGTFARMPDSVTVNIKTPGLGAAQAMAKALRGQLQWLNGRRIVIYTDIRGDTYARLPEGRIPERWGGIREARVGLLDEASVFPGNGPLYAFAEPETRGEAFIPKDGDLARSRDIAGHVVTQWLGGHVTWGPQQQPAAASGGVTVENLNVQAWTDRFSVRQIQDELASRGAI